MANSILFCIALVLCAIGQRVVAFQSITSLRSQLKVLQQNRLSSTSENAPTEVEKPRAETLSDAYISPLSIEPSVVTAADPDIASKIKSGVRNFPALNELQLSSIFGSTLTGLILGGISDFSLPSTIEPWIAPLIGSLWFGGGSLLIEQSDSDKAKNVVQTIFGKPTLTVKNKIQKSITTTIDNTIAAIVKKKNDVVNGIKAIPTNVKLAILASLDNTKNKIQKKTNEAVDKVLESPRLFINGVRKNIDDKVTEVKTSIKNQVDAVLAGPRELQVTIAKSINSITNPEPPQAVEIKEVPPTEVNAVQAIKQVIETETERPKVSPKRIEEPAQLKLPTLSLNLPFGGDKKEEKATKKEPVAVAQKPIVQQPAAPAKQSSNTVKSSSAAPSPFQFSFGGLNTYSKGSSSVTTKVTAAPKAVVSTSNSAKTTQTSLKETTVSKSTPQISTPAPKPAEKTGGFLSFLASASPPQTSAKSPVPPSATSKVSVKPATPASQSSPVKKEAERKTASSSSLFTFNFGGKSSETYAAPKVTTATSVKASTSAPAKSTSAPAPAPAKASPPQPSKPLFSTGSVKSSSSVTSPSQITATKKTEASSPAKPLFSTGSVKTSQSSTSATSSKPSTPIASKPLFSTGSIKTSTSASAAPSNTNSKTSPTSTTAPSLLSTSAVKTLKGYSLGDVSISTIDTATQQYNSGKISARQLYATVLNEVKSKDRTNNALPYIIGSLPQGQQKLELNQYYQQIA